MILSFIIILQVINYYILSITHLLITLIRDLILFQTKHFVHTLYLNSSYKIIICNNLGSLYKKKFYKVSANNLIGERVTNLAYAILLVEYCRKCSIV